jgi:hypothetical protein
MALPPLQGWQDGRGLWMVPIVEVAEMATSAYNLLSTKEVVRFLHATLGYPVKATLLTAAQHGNLVTFPGMTL